MIINSEKLKNVCSKILGAVDSNELSIVTETLELKTENNQLIMGVTNREYFVEIALPIDTNEEFHATVNANLFLKLISQITTADIELSCDSSSLNIKANGKYKLALIFDDNELLELPRIELKNPVKSFTVSSDILNSILNYNSKELLKGAISKPVQKLYYVDEQGAITFTSGACVNNFTLSEPIKLLLNDRVVKLFKLFKDCEVAVTLAYDSIDNNMIQTKIAFTTGNIKLTAILLNDDSLIASVPVSAIRGRANNIYNYSVNMDKNSLLQTINRLMLFNSGNGLKENLKPYSLFEFNNDYVKIWDVNKINNEVIKYTDCTLPDNYSAMIDLVDFKATLDTCAEQYITLSFGDHQAFIISRGSIKNILPEVRTV